jgi:hypothetical protein
LTNVSSDSSRLRPNEASRIDLHVRAKRHANFAKRLSHCGARRAV